MQLPLNIGYTREKILNFAHTVHSSIMKKIKFIWDFRGPGALQTARHHEIHLKEFCQMEDLKDYEAGHQVINEVQAIAYVTTPAAHLKLIRDRLRPHRAVQA